MGKSYEHNIEAVFGFTKEEETERYWRLMEKINAGHYVLSASSLKQFFKSPKHFIKYKCVKSGKTDAAKRGTLIDDIIYNQGVTKLQFLNIEERPDQKHGMTSKVNKAWKAEQEETIGQQYLITEKIYDQAVTMADAVLNDPEAKAILDKSIEFQRKVEFEYLGHPFVSYFDNDTPDEINDLKSCPDSHVSKFKWKIRDKDSRFDIQMALYQIGDGRNKKCSITAVDTSSNVCIFDLHEETLARGRADIQRAVEGWERCVKENLWNAGYSFWSPTGRYRI